MWSPTHIQVLVKKARGLNIKGKNGTNDAFVTIGLGKEKYQTSVKEKATENVEWCEQCELQIPRQGNTAEIVLTALHRNFLGVDEFLGLVTIPLSDFDVYERPKTKWYPLKCKPGKNKTDYRGDLEVRISFTVKSVTDPALGSTADLSTTKKDKNKGSLQSLNKAATNFGGSLMSLGTKEKKNLKKFAKKQVDKAKRTLSKTNLNHKDDPSALPNKFDPSSFSRMGSGRSNRDPGVNSDDEDDMFKFDELSHRSSGSSLNVGNLGVVSKTSTPISGSFENLGGGELHRRSFGALGARTPTLGGAARRENMVKSATMSRLSDRDGGPPKPPRLREEDEPVLDEWEAKLLGKKTSVPYQSPSEKGKDTLSQISQFSQNSQNSQVEKQEVSRKLPEAPSSQQRPISLDETPSGRKKKIIPVSDFESSPSPESPRSPRDDHGFPIEDKAEVIGEEMDKKRKSIGLKLKSSYRSLVETGRTGSLFNLNQLNKGFRSDKDFKSPSRQLSQESLNSSRHSRTHSDGSGGLPPSGTRVVLGRETTPTPSGENQPSRIPKEVWDRFEGKTREDLIEMIVNLQASVESHARKQGDLEDYIDALLIKVLANQPALLQKDLMDNGQKFQTIK